MVLAAALIVVLASAAAIQIVWAVRASHAKEKRSNRLWIPFVISVGISIVVASFDVYVIMSGIVGDWMRERRAQTLRVEEAVSCQQGVAVECSKLAALWMWGLGGSVDLGRAQGLYEKACANGDESACTTVTMIVEGRGPDEYRYLRRFPWPPRNPGE